MWMSSLWPRLIQRNTEFPAHEPLWWWATPRPRHGCGPPRHSGRLPTHPPSASCRLKPTDPAPHLVSRSGRTRGIILIPHQGIYCPPASHSESRPVPTSLPSSCQHEHLLILREWPLRVSQVALKNPTACRRHKTARFNPWGGEIPGGGTATHCSILAWRSPWTEEPGRLQSVWLHRVRHGWSSLAHTHTMTSESLIHIRTPKRESYTHDSIKINAQNSHPPTPYDLDACITRFDGTG